MYVLNLLAALVPFIRAEKEAIHLEKYDSINKLVKKSEVVFTVVQIGEKKGRRWTKNDKMKQKTKITWGGETVKCSKNPTTGFLKKKKKRLDCSPEAP